MIATMAREATERAQPEDDRLDLGAWADRLLSREPAVGLAVGVIRGGHLESFHGHGVADIASGTPITEDTIFRIASITKTFTAIAVMQLCEQGLVDLDAPANDYLRAYRLIPAKVGHRPATVRHLLTHTAGLPEIVHSWDALRPDFGESVEAGRPVPSLATFYHGGLRAAAEPGTRFVYGNHSPATLGQLVEDVSGMPFGRYLREHVFEPLGMDDTDIIRSERVRTRLATGYALRSGRWKAVDQRDMVTAGAASIYSTPRDMARFIAALLRGGAGEHGSVLQPATVASLFAPQYQPDARLPGMGLAFFRADLGGHRAVEHHGVLPGFDSQILLAPDDGVGVMAFTNGARQAMLWLPFESSRLLKALLGVPDDGIRTDVPQRPEVWDGVRGWYQLAAGLSDIRLRGMIGAGAEVFARDGRLMLRFLTPIPALFRGFALHPDDPADPYAFRIDMSEFGMGTARVVFGRSPSGETTSLHLELMPVTLRKRSAGTNPRRWVAGIAGVLGLAAAAVAVRRRR